MNKVQKIFKKRAGRNRSWKITATILLTVVSVAAARSLATNKELINETKQPSGSKTNPDCLEVMPIVLHGPFDDLDNETCTGFVSELDAVIAAMDAYNPLSITKDREYMGVIIHNHDRYYYSVTASQPGSGKASITVQRWMLHRATALWHTHGSSARERRYFSYADTRLANSLGKRFYLGDAMGNLRVFRPGGKVYSGFLARKMGLPTRRGFASGELVEDENGHAISIADEHPVKPQALRNEGSEFLVTCIRKSS